MVAAGLGLSEFRARGRVFYLRSESANCAAARPSKPSLALLPQGTRGVGHNLRLVLAWLSGLLRFILLTLWSAWPSRLFCRLPGPGFGESGNFRGEGLGIGSFGIEALADPLGKFGVAFVFRIFDSVK